jgi:hypothetical protein
MYNEILVNQTPLNLGDILPLGQYPKMESIKEPILESILKIVYPFPFDKPVLNLVRIL